MYDPFKTKLERGPQRTPARVIFGIVDMRWASGVGSITNWRNARLLGNE